MKILVDADSCPVKDIILQIAIKYNIEVILFFDTSHVFTDDYAKVITVDKGKDSVDFKLISHLEENDFVITQDYGVACIALSKKANVLNQNGLIYTNENIESLLLSRYLSQKERKNKQYLSGPKKRTKENDQNFKVNFLNLVEEKLKI